MHTNTLAIQVIGHRMLEIAMVQSESYSNLKTWQNGMDLAEVYTRARPSPRR